MDKLTPPDPLDIDSSNVSDVWRKWKQCFELFSLASGLSSKEELRNPSRDTTRDGVKAGRGLGFLG